MLLVTRIEDVLQDACHSVRAAPLKLCQHCRLVQQHQSSQYLAQTRGPKAVLACPALPANCADQH